MRKVSVRLVHSPAVETSGEFLLGLVTVSGAADALGVDEQEVLYRVRTLEILTVRVNGRRMIPEVELQRYRPPAH